jgi:hypothetical protein
MEKKQELGEKMEFQYLEKQLRHLSDVHKNLKELGKYAPALRKPKPEEVKTAALMAQVKDLKKDLDNMKGGGGGGTGAGGGTPGGNRGKRDKSNIECHACHQKGHMKFDKECPKYSETMAKKNQGGGDSNSGNQSQKNAWKYTKTTDVVERNGNKFYYCPKCNGGKGMYVSSHGPGHPTKPAHDDNFRANRQRQQQQSSGNEQQNLAVDTVGGDEGDTISFGGVEFGVPSGTYLCVLDDAESDASPKAYGR